DMVINIGMAKAHNWEFVYEDIKAVVDAANGVLVKVIIECCYLTDEEKVEACKASMRAGADFVKTSTGFGTSGATVEDVRLMKKTVGTVCQVKAAGGIRDKATFEAMIEAGADRIGCSCGAKIMEEYANE
ncbi:MAG: deoxyribose-phosphate aldolase, partial [Anaeroplasmataceae bacterium]|nr:deoxyribose-phosphate aldolase [Anaeroplasmataceae bacterium]